MQRFPMTINGEKLLRKELEFLKKVERHRISDIIASSREIGDLKENAEYHSAKEQQSFIEGRISDIENKLSNSQVIDVKNIPQDNRVVFSSTVVLMDIRNNVEKKLNIVGEDEADLKKSKISINSPIARGLIGKHIDEIVVINTPSGEVEYKIMEVLYI